MDTQALYLAKLYSMREILVQTDPDVSRKIKDNFGVFLKQHRLINSTLQSKSSHFGSGGGGGGGEKAPVAAVQQPVATRSRARLDEDRGSPRAAKLSQPPRDAQIESILTTVSAIRRGDGLSASTENLATATATRGSQRPGGELPRLAANTPAGRPQFLKKATRKNPNFSTYIDGIRLSDKANGPPPSTSGHLTQHVVGLVGEKTFLTTSVLSSEQRQHFGGLLTGQTMTTTAASDFHPATFMPASTSMQNVSMSSFGSQGSASMPFFELDSATATVGAPGVVKAGRFVPHPTNASSIERIKKMFHLNEIKARSPAGLATFPYPGTAKKEPPSQTATARAPPLVAHRALKLAIPLCEHTEMAAPELGIFPTLRQGAGEGHERRTASPVKQAASTTGGRPRRFKSKLSNRENGAVAGGGGGGERYIRLVEAEEINNANMLLAKRMLENSRKASTTTTEPGKHSQSTEHSSSEHGAAAVPGDYPIRIYLRDRSLAPPTTPQSECHACLACVECQREIEAASSRSQDDSPRSQHQDNETAAAAAAAGSLGHFNPVPIAGLN